MEFRCRKNMVKGMKIGKQRRHSSSRGVGEDGCAGQAGTVWFTCQLKTGKIRGTEESRVARG